MVAGLMEMPDDAGPMPPFWMVYFAVDDGPASVEAIRAGGGRILRDLAEIPGTGRFALCADPQGAGLGILEPAPMPQGSPGGNAFDQQKPGHGNWHELMTPQPEAALAFYGGVFGWTKGQAMDMGAMGTYQIFHGAGSDLGGIMGQGKSPVPAWLPYFGVPGIGAAQRQVESGGGKLMHGPMEVPGGAMILVAQDPQGAVFAVVGPKD
jgi:predicted enzyme related to lactoylglutathione lyase